MTRIPDPRHLSNGRIIPTSSYSDQPYLLKTKDSVWLCSVTTGAGIEGQPGQTIITLRSRDRGKTWSEPVYVEPPDGPEASYAVMLIVPSGRIYIFYNHNTDNIRDVPAEECEWFPDGICLRVDSLGYYVFKYSDDDGQTWSAERYPIPVREMDIDRRDPFEGKIRYFWNVGKPFIHAGAAYCSLHKVGGFGEGFFTRSEGVLLKSINLLTETDPTKITWETLPDGDYGLRMPPGGGPIAEEQSYVVLSDGSFFCVYRTIDGHPACSYSRDGGYTWSKPDWMRFADGRPMKHPRAANFVWKCKNGKYLYWFHNHGGKFIRKHLKRRTISYNDRNPAWLCGGVEVDSHQGKVIVWSQPEILLYDDDPYVRISYPDLIEDSGRYYISETQKNIARVHLIDTKLLEGLWKQGENDCRSQDLLQVFGEGFIPANTPGKMKRLPKFLERDETRPDYGVRDLRQGFTFEFIVKFNTLDAGQIVLDNRTRDGRGFVVQTTFYRTLEIMMNDGRTECHWECDPGIIEKQERYHIVIIVDGGPKIITWVINGRLCDGGEDRQFGWGRFSPNLISADGGIDLLNDVDLYLLAIYNRPLRVSEAIANFQFLRKMQ
jgi:hypothetical protein